MDGPATSFPIVTLGASAGGLAAFEEFFASTPADTGAAFIVITHQHVGHPSLLRELIDRRTPMGVIEVRENTAVAPNQVYIAEPGWMLTIHEGVLKPIEPRDGEGTPTPIDYFLRSLARDQRERAIAIILSGTGNDGSLGIKEIKGALGMVMVQQEQSAAFAGMPHSAIATGLVDYVLPAREMPGTLLAYIRGGGRDLAQTRTPQPTPHEALSQIFTLLRGRTRHDFSQYKRVTVLRRVERRMNVHNLRRIEQYVRFLRETPGELDLLFRDLLIGVTSFFRDVDAFTALAAGLRERLANKPSDYVVRAWVPGCSTGEEVYTIAIILRECMDELDHPLSVQLYATDLDPEAIDIARAGTYPQGIANDVSRQRLARFFHAEEDRFRIRKEIRDMVIFAPQDLIADPPFTRLDLLSCRNLLIYLESELQRRLIPLFHYALKPGGLLLLGSSESIGGYGLLFEPLHKKWKLFRRVEVSEGTYIANFPASLPNASTTLAPRATLRRAGADEVELEGPERLLLREVVPPTVLVHERGDIVHIHGRTGLFLEPSPGPQPVANIFNMARAGLEVGLLAALRHAAAESNEVIHTGVQVRGEGDVTLVDLRVRPVATPGPYHGLYLISFERARSAGPPSASSMTPPDPDDVEGIERRDQLAQLECELQRTREIHQSTIEELETTNEDLKSTNEELQST
ncbi:MAG: hypothetical protein KC636_11310, partial [Myxococcales bacterium]|nr:hypothetical protein [Myxococcales bacterium]